MRPRRGADPRNAKTSRRANEKRQEIATRLWKHRPLEFEAAPPALATGACGEASWLRSTRWTTRCRPPKTRRRRRGQQYWDRSTSAWLEFHAESGAREGASSSTGPRRTGALGGRARRARKIVPRWWRRGGKPPKALQDRENQQLDAPWKEKLERYRNIVGHFFSNTRAGATSKSTLLQGHSDFVKTSSRTWMWTTTRRTWAPISQHGCRRSSAWTLGIAPRAVEEAEAQARGPRYTTSFERSCR